MAIGGDRKNRGGRTVTAGAALAPFGAAPSCKERPAFVVDGDGCDPRALVGARGRVALVRRGGCGFAEKAYVAAAQGAFGVIVLETDAGRLGAEAPVATDEAFLARHPAARDVAVAVVGFEGAQQIRFALSEHAARRGVAARLVFGGCEGDKARPKDLGSVDAAEAEAAALVQAAFRPGAPRTFDFATHTLRGALWTLSGGVNETLGVVAAGARGLPARTEQLPAPVVLADVEKCAAATERGAVVALAVRNCSCAGCSLHDVVPTLAAPSMVLLLPDDDDAPPRCAFSGAVPVAAAPSGIARRAPARRVRVARQHAPGAAPRAHVARARGPPGPARIGPTTLASGGACAGPCGGSATIVLRARISTRAGNSSPLKVGGGTALGCVVLLCCVFFCSLHRRGREREREFYLEPAPRSTDRSATSSGGRGPVRH